MSRTLCQQPKVSAAHKLLGTRVHEGLALDLYGVHEEDGYMVLDLALAGTNISLFEAVSIEFLSDLSDWCNDNLPTGAELRKAQLDAARVEHAIWRHELEAA